MRYKLYDFFFYKDSKKDCNGLK